MLVSVHEYMCVLMPGISAYAPADLTPLLAPRPKQAANASNKGSSKTVAATVTITPFDDPDGSPTDITITGVTANRGAPPVCPCTAAQRRSGCQCMPDATMVGNGSAVSLLPLLQTRDAVSKEVGTTVRIAFTATSQATGLSCSGYVEVCSARTSGPKPPQCRDYSTTHIVRDLTACSG